MMGADNETVAATTDGRIARRRRNQGTVLDAVVELFESGNADPAVEDVAEWSGVSTRSIYRYFHHREGLIDAAMWHLVAKVEREMPLSIAPGPLDHRIGQFVAHRLAVYQRFAPLIRAAPRSAHPAATDGVVDDRPVFSTNVATCFADEFGRLPGSTRRQAEVAADMALQFASLEFLTQSFDGDVALVAELLSRHIARQLTPAAD